MQFLKTGSTEALNWALAVFAVIAIGFGTATAAISVAPREAVNPALRTLSAGPSIQLQRASRDAEEDCFWTVEKRVQPDGRVKQVRTLECAH